MYIRPYYLNKLLLCLTAVMLLISWRYAYSLTSDENQPIQIEADTAELDDLNHVSIYRGDVIATQGSIRMTGDILTVHFTDDNDMEILIIEGQPATYRQLPENTDTYDEAKAVKMEYYDSGKGFDSKISREQGGIGLKLIELLSTQLKGEAKFNSEKATFLLIFPNH